jgi:hypothetical protein
MIIKNEVVQLEQEESATPIMKLAKNWLWKVWSDDMKSLRKNIHVSTDLHNPHPLNWITYYCTPHVDITMSFCFQVARNPRRKTRCSYPPQGRI